MLWTESGGLPHLLHCGHTVSQCYLLLSFSLLAVCFSDSSGKTSLCAGVSVRQCYKGRGAVTMVQGICPVTPSANRKHITLLPVCGPLTSCQVSVITYKNTLPHPLNHTLPIISYIKTVGQLLLRNVCVFLL